MQKNGRPRFAFSEPSIGSTTTTPARVARRRSAARPAPRTPAGTRCRGRPAASSRRTTAASASWSITVVSSPPSPRPTTGSRSSRVGSRAQHRRPRRRRRAGRTRASRPSQSSDQRVRAGSPTRAWGRSTSTSAASRARTPPRACTCSTVGARSRNAAPASPESTSAVARVEPAHVADAGRSSGTARRRGRAAARARAPRSTAASIERTAAGYAGHAPASPPTDRSARAISAGCSEPRQTRERDGAGRRPRSARASTTAAGVPAGSSRMPNACRNRRSTSRWLITTRWVGIDRQALVAAGWQVHQDEVVGPVALRVALGARAARRGRRAPSRSGGGRRRSGSRARPSSPGRRRCTAGSQTCQKRCTVPSPSVACIVGSPAICRRQPPRAPRPSGSS